MTTRRNKKIIIEDEDEEENINNNIKTNNNTKTNNNSNNSLVINNINQDYIEYYQLKERIESLAKLKNINLSTYKPSNKIKTIDDFKIKYKVNKPIKSTDNINKSNNNNNNNQNIDNKDIVYKTPINNKLVKEKDRNQNSDSDNDGQQNSEEVYKTPVRKGKRLSSHLKTLKRLSVSSQVLDYLSNETLSGQQVVQNNSGNNSKNNKLDQTPQEPINETLQSILENDDEDVELIILNSAKKNNKIDSSKSLEQLLLDKSPVSSVSPSTATAEIYQTPKKKEDDNEENKEDKNKEDEVLELLSKTTITPKPEKKHESNKEIQANTKATKSPSTPTLPTNSATNSSTTKSSSTNQTLSNENKSIPTLQTSSKSSNTVEKSIKPTTNTSNTSNTSNSSNISSTSTTSTTSTTLTTSTTSTTSTNSTTSTTNASNNTTLTSTTDTTVPTKLNKNDSNMKKLIKEFRLTSLGDNNNNNNNNSNKSNNIIIDDSDYNIENGLINNNLDSNKYQDFNKTKSFYPIEPNNDKYNQSMLCSPLNLDTALLPGVKEYFERDKKIHAISYFKRYNRTVFQNKFPQDMIIWSDEHLSTPGKTTITKKNDVNFAKIVLSSKLVNSIETLANVLCHEMCHAATWMFDNSKKAHGPEFKFWVRIAQSQYPELSIDMCDNFKSTFPYHYKCQSKDCDVSFGRATLAEDLLYCGKCQSPIVPVEKVESESRFDKFLKDHLEETQKKHPNLSLDEIKSIIQLKWRNYQVEQEKLKKKEKQLLNQNNNNNTTLSPSKLSLDSKSTSSNKTTKSKLMTIPIDDLPIPTSKK